MRERNRLILDTDGGVDDAQALVMLVGNGVVPFAITTVFGNVGLDQATTNILAVAATLGVSIPVYKGAALPLIQPVIDARNVHGDDGLGGAPRPDDIGTIEALHAVDFLRQVLTEAVSAGEKIDILMIGPLTNLALALRLAPEIAAGIGQLTIMGGTLNGRGNASATAEFNTFADPEAASIVLTAGLDIVLVTWECCLAHRVSGAAVDTAFAKVASSTERAFSEALSSHLRGNSKTRGRGDTMLFIDPLAAAIVVDPSIVSASFRARVDTALAPGVTRGMTVIDQFGWLTTTECTIVEKADLDRLVGLYAVSIDYRKRRS